MAKKAAATKEPNARAQGFGESKIFGGAKIDDSPGLDWAKLTVNGQPIPEALWGHMPYKLTDQGAIEANGGRPLKVVTVDEIIARKDNVDELEKAHRARRSAQEKGLPVPLDAARTIANAARAAGAPLDDKENFQGTVDAFADGNLNDWLATEEDPQSMIMHEALPVGHRGLWMSKAKIAREGMVRGILKYRLVLKDGQPIEMGNMLLGSVPIAAAERQEQHYADINRQNAVNAVERVRDQTDRIASAAKLDHTARKKYQDDTTIGFVDEDREAADRELVDKFATYARETDDVD